MNTNNLYKNIPIKSLIFAALLISWPSCGPADSPQDHATAPSGLFLADGIRQQGITEDHMRDNFNFDQFASVNWSNATTFGAGENNAIITKDNIPDIKGYHLGIKPENYYNVAIRGDGNCWLRAGMISILHMVFTEQALFDEFIEQIQVVAKKYNNVPGFATRYYPESFAELIKKLHNMSPQERLAQYNTKHVDKFLTYTLRAVLHAYTYRNSHRYYPIEEFLKKRIKDGAWGVATDINIIWQEFLPSKGFFMFDNQNNLIEILDPKKRLYFGYKKHLLSLTSHPDLAEVLNNYFNIKNIDDFLTARQLDAVPYFVNGNHFNLAIKKSAAVRFGYQP